MLDLRWRDGRHDLEAPGWGPLCPCEAENNRLRRHSSSSAGTGLEPRPTPGRLHDFLLATFLGLSWFLLAHVSAMIGRGSLAIGWFTQEAWWHVLSATMLILGIAVYVPVAVYVTRSPDGSKRARLRALGLLPSSRTAVIRSAILVVTGVIVSGPIAVWDALQEHFHDSPLGVLASLQPPLIEEFLVRGIVWAVLLRSFPASVALVWSSVLFWVWHWGFGLAASSITAGIGLLACAFPRLASGLIWPGVVFHLMGNAGIGQFLVLPVALVATVLMVRDFARAKDSLTRR